MGRANSGRNLDGQINENGLRWYEVITPIVGPIKYILRNETSPANWARALFAVFVSTELVPYLTFKGIEYLAK